MALLLALLCGGIMLFLLCGGREKEKLSWAGMTERLASALA